MPMSWYAFFRGLSAIAFAPAVGLYIDTGNRLKVVRVSIGQSCRELAVILCSIDISSPASLPESRRRGIVRHLLHPPQRHPR